MKILGTSCEIDGLEIKRSIRKDNEYFEIQKNGKVGHINKEIPLFKNEMDAEEWIKDNFGRIKWGKEGLSKENLIYFYSGDITIFRSSKERLKSILNKMLKEVKNHGEDGAIGAVGKNFTTFLREDVHYNLKTRVIEMGERSKEEKDAYSEYKSIKYLYKKEKEILGGNIFSVVKFNIYLFLALTFLFIYFGVMGFIKAQEGMWFPLLVTSIFLLPVFITQLIKSIKRYRDILHAKKELKFIVESVV
ncbi:hypothetical protein ACFLRB_01335 [Acidobacteriota bacterium]